MKRDLLDDLASAPPLARKLAQIRDGAESTVVFEHVTESAQPFLAAILVRELKQRLWLVCPDVRSQETMHNELLNWFPEALFFPESELAPFAGAVADPETTAERLAIVQKLSDPKNRHPIVLTKASLSDSVPTPATVKAQEVWLRPKMKLDRDQLIAQLAEAGYERVAQVSARRQFAAIGRVFGCPVANGYGARDAGFIAHECPSGSLHISAEDIVVETVRADGSPAADGEAGEIVVTHLATGDFPFVRYRTGDVGILGHEACACGRGLPVLKEVQGRSTDFVVAKDGTVMHGLALIYTLRDLPGVQRFRIEQVSLDETRVRLVADGSFNSAAEQRIMRDFQARLGHGVRIVVERVDAIENEASGKFRYVVSRVPAATAASERIDA